ncbi:hypothetical protein E4U54_007572 [Claviceps lovelessii]|nr:hypothetical protein E4U54_007572 [Claviceps lovelessii]
MTPLDKDKDKDKDMDMDWTGLDMRIRSVTGIYFARMWCPRARGVKNHRKKKSKKQGYKIMPSSQNTYTALDAARAARNGAFITAWPPDEPYFAPSVDQLILDIAKAKSKAKIKIKAKTATRDSSPESLAQ